MTKKLLLILVFLITTVSTAQCDYTLELTDNFGSEWDSGANLTANTGVDVTIAGITTTYLVMDPAAVSGAPAVENYIITVNDGDAIDIDYRATAFSGDGSFRFIDSEGIEVYASPINQASMMDIYVGTATCPTCFAVTMLTSNNLTATGAEIGWTATGTETAWEVEYGPVGFTPGSGTIDNATTNPWTIDGLSASTSYDVYIRADCGMGDISSNQGPLNFTTTDSCPVPSAFNPITQTADAVQFTWDTNGNVSANYEIEYAPSPYVQGAGGTTVLGFSAPFASVTGLTSNTSYDFYVRIDCGMGDFSGWAGPYTASTLQSCPDISGIAFSNVDQTSVDIAWSNGGTETEWEIEYTTDAGISTLVTATSNPFTLTGLSSGTSYDICVIAVCAPTDRSTPVCDSLLTPADYCNGDQLIDSGGLTGNYSSNENITYTVCPDNAGDVAYVDFLTFVVQAGFTTGCTDSLTIYDGADTTAATINPPGGGTTWCWDNGSGTGDLAGMQLIGKLPSGCLTFVFQSSGFTELAGFTADVTCALPPTCPAPFDFSFDGSTNTTADLSWTAGGSETEWNIEYGITGFTPGMGTVVNSTTNPVTITGLTQNSIYDFYITGFCGVGDESTQVGAVTGSTQCDPFVAPYSEDFETGFTTTTSTFPGAGEAFDSENCYSAINSGYAWVAAPGTLTASGNTGPSPSITTGNYFYAEGSNGVTGDIAELATATFDTSALTVPALSFDYHMTGSDIGSLEILVKSGASETLVATITGEQQLADTDPYINFNVALSAFSGQTFQIVFRATRGASFESDIAIDNVAIDEAPSCPAALGLTVDSSTVDSISLSWTNGGSETAWEIEYVDEGAAQGSGTLVPVTTNPATVTGLVANTPYDFYLRAVCSVGDESIWLGPVTGRTTCVAFTVPFTEGFNSTSSTQDCWTVLDENGDGDQWDLNYAFNSSEGDQVAAMNTDFNGGADDDYLISPAITLTGVDRLRYEYRVQSNGEPNEMEVLISTTGNAAADFTTTLVPLTLYSNEAYAEEVVDLSAYTGDVYVAWRIPPTTTDGWRMYIDNVRFEITPDCDEPVMIDTSGFTVSSVDIAFTERGTATSWEIEYGAPGFIPGSGTVITATTNPYTLSGLTDNTSYDFYIRSACASGGFSPWSAVSNFQTACNAFAVPFTETFDSTSTTEGCWTVLDENGDGDQWILNSATSAAGDEAASINTDFNGGVDDDYLISPALTLTGAQRLRYMYRAQSIGEPNDMEVLLSTTGTDAADFTVTLLPTAQYGNTTYQEEVINLSAYTGDVYIAFRIPPNGTDGWIMYIDEFIVEDLPACVEPSGLTAANITSDSADFSWISGGSGESSWDVEIVPAGITPTGVPTDVVTSTSYLATGLSTATAYDFYVRADCGSGTSVFTGPLSFTTTAACGDTIYDTGGSTGNYQNNESYTITYFPDNVGDLVTLDFSLVDVENCCDTLEVFDGIDVTATPFTNDLESPATFRANNADGAITIRFTSDGSIANAGWEALYTCSAPPSCLEPTSLVVDAVASTSANASWTSLSVATVWQVEVQPATVAQGTVGAVYENLTSTNPQVISGLSAQTTYDLYVRADCGSGDFSNWVGPVTFTTLCDVVTQYPYVTDFTTNVPNQCWDEAIDGEIVDGPIGLGSSDWTDGRSYENAAGVAVPSNTINLWQNVDREWLISEQFDMSGSSNDVLTVEVAVTDYSFTGPSTANDIDAMGSDDQVDLLITTDNGVTWSSLMTWNLANQPAVTGTSSTIDLSSYTGTVQFAFLASDGDIDDTEDYDFHVGVFEIDGTASNDAFAKAEFVIYPNPVSTVLYVQADVSVKKLTIYNLVGQLIKSREINNRAEINVQELPSGVYLIEINGDTATETFRFIKE
ncbi:putative secreted protein (Por secretion system target) [Nonlabens xylanidelens]|uniref:Putative secreted protein (Por secretion system target) n=1 Tax=Nonlabens xylanidelens TaxID=191564 RepID=A0A2S6ILB0_9FLAO|nr:choice-of-anchor J domain-containing protein [Nonlabens xylanidelens]PPK94961.1 putative secreted protein (Por secretion system target) [Nonlabens xylanidelens]PQJ17505.1 hemagluttinin family protein [Nonlabens xylanidelens]